MANAPVLRQSAGNAVGSGQSRTCGVTLTQPTIEGNLIVVTAATTHGDATLRGPSGFTLIRDRSQGDLRVAMWYREGAPSMNSIRVDTNRDRALQVRVLEYQGAAQSGALDEVAVLTSRSNRCRTGQTGVVAQDDEVVVAAIVNHYASTTQSGFEGPLSKLIDQVTPQSWGWYNYDPDEWRCRMTMHHCIGRGISAYELACILSSTRHWVAIIACFKGGSIGPARMTATGAETNSVCNTDGTGQLTVFGPLRAVDDEIGTPMVTTDGQQARIGPFNYQYRLGGWSGLLVGDSTIYNILSHDGLEGWELRTSDDDLPRGDGALRGVDLQSSRQILFELKVGADGDGTKALVIQSEVENAMDVLYRALVPQRDTDWELIWRHPGRPLRMVRVRPTNLTRELTWEQTVINEQKIALIAADPRHYSAFTRTTTIPITEVGASIVPKILVNQGNGSAYPTIRVQGPSSGDPVTRVELINITYDVSFVVEAVLPTGSVLVGDMDARATGAARSVVTIDGQSKYGAWQHPRNTFLLGPGENQVHIVTEPAGAPITCTLDYRDTWSG